MNSVRIRLIDTGEVIEHGQFNLQKLPHDIKSLPAAAFRCKINQVWTYDGILRSIPIWYRMQMAGLLYLCCHFV